MNWKTPLKYALLAFVAASVGTIFWQQSRSGSAEAEAASVPAAAVAGPAAATVPARPGENKILVYYFYTSVRCPTCRQIEAQSEAVLKSAFGDALGKGLIEWLPTNVQLPQNRHFVRDYELFTKSLVIVRLKDGQQVEWKKLEKVWELVSDTKAFSRYVQDEIRAWLRKL
ncbi:MAG: nitrophenyl compound nitroreductase subunit ArsF family protein [Bryobacteraceae bacterium]